MKQPVTHVPASVHCGAIGEHRRPHVPQLFGSSKLVSQPLASLPSQLPRIAGHIGPLSIGTPVSGRTPVSSTPVSTLTPVSITTPVSVTVESIETALSSPTTTSGRLPPLSMPEPSMPEPSEGVIIASDGGLARSGAASSAGTGGEQAPSATSAAAVNH